MDPCFLEIVEEVLSGINGIPQPLKVWNLIEKMCYEYKNKKSDQKEDISLHEVQNYFFEECKHMLPPGIERFKYDEKLLQVQRLRYQAGVIATNDAGGYLVIENNDNQISFTKGKEDFQDNSIKKVTAFRELGEESGYWVTDSEYIGSKYYFEIECYKKVFTFYILRKIDEEKINYEHTVNGEVKRVEVLAASFDCEQSERPLTKLFKIAYPFAKKALHLKDNSFFTMERYKLLEDKNPEVGLQEFRKIRKLNEE